MNYSALPPSEELLCTIATPNPPPRLPGPGPPLPQGPSLFFTASPSEGWDRRHGERNLKVIESNDAHREPRGGEAAFFINYTQQLRSCPIGGKLGNLSFSASVASVRMTSKSTRNSRIRSTTIRAPPPQAPPVYLRCIFIKIIKG